MKLESRFGKSKYSPKQVYSFITDFNNFKNMLPADKVKDWQSDSTSCSFSVDPLGKTGFKLADKIEFSKIQLNSIDQSPFAFGLTIFLKTISDEESEFQFVFDADINPMIAMMAKTPLTNLLETLVSRMEQLDFS
ncbi:MAG: hypothetical protein IPM71_05250 [Bacteroidota bacterium]|nr:MAG: hypothetical protein IPM71_05250 [Bacteroidota bacterium]